MVSAQCPDAESRCTAMRIVEGLELETPEAVETPSDVTTAPPRFSGATKGRECTEAGPQVPARKNSLDAKPLLLEEDEEPPRWFDAICCVACWTATASILSSCSMGRSVGLTFLFFVCRSGTAKGDHRTGEH